MWRVLPPGGAIVSYDMRPTPAPIRRLATAARARARQGHPAGAVTPTTPIPRPELRRLFPDAELHARSASLHLDLGLTLGRRSAVLAGLAAALPWLRTHLLVTVEKRS